MSAFNDAVAIVLRHEGDTLVNDPADPGGLTRYGISKRSYPNEDIAAMTPARAAAIYFTDFWLRFNFGQLPPAVGAKLLDGSVAMGGDAASRCLQRALRACGSSVAEDGSVGTNTLAAVNGVDPRPLLAAVKSELAAHYRLVAQANPTEAGFLKGWLNRAYE